MESRLSSPPLVVVLFLGHGMETLKNGMQKGGTALHPTRIHPFESSMNWAKASTFRQVHDGKVADYTGMVIGAGCCVKVSLDLVRKVRQKCRQARAKSQCVPDRKIKGYFSRDSEGELGIRVS